MSDQNAQQFTLVDRIAAARIVERAHKQQYDGIRKVLGGGSPERARAFAAWRSAQEALTSLLSEYVQSIMSDRGFFVMYRG